MEESRVSFCGRAILNNIKKRHLYVADEHKAGDN